MIIQIVIFAVLTAFAWILFTDNDAKLPEPNSHTRIPHPRDRRRRPSGAKSRIREAVQPLHHAS